MLEKLDIGSLILKASPLQGTKNLTALDLVYAHPEFYESASPMADVRGER